jgi:two-component system chemotaxis response regulator CheY
MTDAPATVLIVDDDPFIRRLILTTLEDVAGFELREAADGEDALEAAGEQPPTLVFLDIDMPRRDGISTCRELRARHGADPRIVMLTAAGRDQEAAARDAGADHFLTKPFSPLDLLRLVDELGARR